MPIFKKRVFGAEVEEDVRLELQRLATGGRIVEKTSADGDILKSVNPTYDDYLGDKTPQCRMWCAVAVNNWREAAWSAWDGEKIYQNSSGLWFYWPYDDETGASGPAVDLGLDSEAEKLVFSINENKDFSTDSVNSNSKPLESTDGSEKSSSKIKFIPQLTVNPHMKPEAGITSVRSKSQGAIGAIISATVEFVVHNKHDFENIYLPYFMRPGAIVCLDYGWSDVPLYDIFTKVQGDEYMSKFDEEIYHPKTGFQARNFGKVRTVVGNVVNYSSNVTNEGSYECSIEIVSRNAGLLEKKVKGDLQNLFVNSINDVLALVMAEAYGLNTTGDENPKKLLSLDHIRKNLTSPDPIDTREVAKRFISELSDKTSGELDTIGMLPELSVRKGIFHQDMAVNKVFDEKDESSRSSVLSKKSSKEIPSDLREKIVTDDILQKERTYISYGLFEDLFLNNFAKGLIKNKLEVDTSDKARNQPVHDRKFEGGPGFDYENNFDTRLTYIRWNENLAAYQRAKLEPNQELPIFMIPDNWDKSYNAIKLGINLKESDPQKMPDKDSEIKWNVSTEDQKTKKHPNYPGIQVMPLRDLFISVNAIQTAFLNNKTVNDALVSLYDEINAASGNVIIIRLVTNDSSSTISAQDVNLNPIEEKRLEFDVTGPSSIVNNLEFKYSTPSDGLSSILAIGNLGGPQTFKDMDLSQFSYLTLLNKPKVPGQYVHVRSLPNQGNLNRFTNQEEGLTLNLEGINRFISEYNVGTPTDAFKNAEEKMQFYYESIKKVGLIEDPKEEKSGVKVSKYKSPAAYEYSIKRGNMYGSERELIKAKIREELSDGNTEGSVAPILPIELSLGIYGNTYLQIGDKFTINYLPDYYKGKVYFQIIQYEDVLDVNGWTTNYQTLMRVEPRAKPMGKGAQEYLLDPNTFLRSKFTSVVRLVSTPHPNVVAAVDDMSQKKQLFWQLNKDNSVMKKFEQANLKMKATKVTFAPYRTNNEGDSWFNSVNMDWTEDVYEHKAGVATGGLGSGAVYLTTQKKTGETIQHRKSYNSNLRFDYTSYISYQTVGNASNLAYSYAMRKLILGENSPLDFSKNCQGLTPEDKKGIRVLFITEKEISTGASWGTNEFTTMLDKYWKKYDLIVVLDAISKPGDIAAGEADITDMLSHFRDINILDSLEAIGKVDFKLNKDILRRDIHETKLGNLDEKVSTDNLNYKKEAPKFGGGKAETFMWAMHRLANLGPLGAIRDTEKEFVVPLLVKGYFFGLDINNNQSAPQDAIVISCDSDKIKAFKHLSIPKWMLKDKEQNGKPIPTEKTIIMDLLKYYIEYKQVIENSITDSHTASVELQKKVKESQKYDIPDPY